MTRGSGSWKCSFTSSTSRRNSGRRACCPVPRTAGLPAKLNWYPRDSGADAEGGWVSTAGSPDLYDVEVRAAGPAGTVVAWAPETFHRGTALTLPRGARYTIHLAYRPACAEWGQRMPWADRGHALEWVPVRAPGGTTAAQAVRLPAARAPLLDRIHPRRHGPTVPRTDATVPFAARQPIKREGGYQARCVKELTQGNYREAGSRLRRGKCT